MERLLSAGELTKVNKCWNVFTRGPSCHWGGHIATQSSYSATYRCEHAWHGTTEMVLGSLSCMLFSDVNLSMHLYTYTVHVL